jgi:acetyl esterase/lipase
VIHDVATKQCMFPTDLPAIPDTLPQDPAKVFAPAFLGAFSSGEWGDYGFVREAFAANAVGPYTQTAPLRIYQGDADEIVPPWTVEAVVKAMRDSGNEVDLVSVPGGTHTDVAFGFLGAAQSQTADAIAWLRGHLDR